MEKILPISLELNFTPNTLNCYWLLDSVLKVCNFLPWLFYPGSTWFGSEACLVHCYNEIYEFSSPVIGIFIHFQIMKFQNTFLSEFLEKVSLYILENLQESIWKFHNR